MGYYTDYTLRIKNIGHDTLEEIRKEMSKPDNNIFEYALDPVYRTVDYKEYVFYPSSEAKWYSHEEDMDNYSKKFPEATFCLEGIGEEAGDIWKEYFKNGKHEMCESVIPEPTTITW